MKKIVIIGGGLSGLSAAWFIKQSEPSASILILEKKDSAGGWIQTIVKEGWRFELGPRGFRPGGKGAATLKLVEQLGLASSLIPSSSSSKKRFISMDGHLIPVSLFFILKRYGFHLLKGLFLPSPLGKDMLVSDFFAKRVSKKFAKEVICPLVQGIFGGESHELSLRCCFPTLYEWEKNHGHFLKGLFKEEKTKNLPALYTFEKGMQQLPDTLCQKLSKHLLLGCEVHTISESYLETTYGKIPYDILLSSHDPSFHRFLTLKTVHMGFSTPLPIPKGFGYLKPCKGPEGFLGMTWDYQIFSPAPSLPLVCAMMRGNMKDEEALELGLQALKEDLNIDEKPSFVHVATAFHAIAQYPVFHQFSSEFPHLKIGYAAGAIGINDCVSQAQSVAEAVLRKIR